MAPALKELSFLDHLEELRWRLIKSAVAVVVVAIPAGIFWRTIFDVVMLYPLRLTNPRPRLIINSPVESVMFSIKIAMACGLIGSAPYVLYQIWCFVAPGLYKNEKAVILPTVFFASIFFLLGVGFCYLVLPYLLRFLASYGEGRMEAFFTLNQYLSFIIQLCLAFGVVFELPVVSYVLTRLGVITPKFMIDKGRYAIVAIFVVAAILTPPDVLSQCMLAAPLLLLYGVSILVSMAVMRKKPA